MKLCEIAQGVERTHTEWWLAKNNIQKCTINEDGTVDCWGDVSLQYTTKSIDVQFRTVAGNFICASTQITSLRGCPHTVSGNFYCGGTRITNLVGAPKVVKGNFNCDASKVTNLEGLPETIGGRFGCGGTPFAVQHLLQVLRYKQIKRVCVDEVLGVEEIINRHLAGDRDILACQDELIDAGFASVAKI